MLVEKDRLKKRFLGFHAGITKNSAFSLFSTENNPPKTITLFLSILLKIDKYKNVPHPDQ